jgi:hypothetical protein
LPDLTGCYKLDICIVLPVVCLHIAVGTSFPLK